MQERFSGVTIVIDVSVGEPIRMHSKWELTCPSGLAILWEKINPFGCRAEIPSIFEVLYRTMCLSTQARLRQMRGKADWLIEPPVQGYRVLNFRAFEKLEDLGYRHTKQMLDEMRKDPALAALRGLQDFF